MVKFVYDHGKYQHLFYLLYSRVGIPLHTLTVPHTIDQPNSYRYTSWVEYRSTRPLYALSQPRRDSSIPCWYQIDSLRTPYSQLTRIKDQSRNTMLTSFIAFTSVLLTLWERLSIRTITAMSDDAGKTDTIRKTRMMLHMLLTLFPAAEKEERMLALAQTLSIFENLHPEEALRFLVCNYDAIYRTQGVRDDFARLLGYESADDPRRIQDTLELREEIDRKYGNQEDQSANTAESDPTPDHREQQVPKVDHFQQGNYALEPGSYALASGHRSPTLILAMLSSWKSI